jgi:hypothetical protein
MGACNFVSHAILSAEAEYYAAGDVIKESLQFFEHVSAKSLLIMLSSIKSSWRVSHKKHFSPLNLHILSIIMSEEVPYSAHRIDRKPQLWWRGKRPTHFSK